jgi:hypothetical protein
MKKVVMFLFTNVCQVVIEHPQGNQSPSDGGLSTSEILLPSDELIHFVYCDGFRDLAFCPFEEDIYIAGIMQ